MKPFKCHVTIGVEDVDEGKDKELARDGDHQVEAATFPDDHQVEADDVGDKNELEKEEIEDGSHHFEANVFHDAVNN